MSDIIRFDPDDSIVPRRVKAFLKSVNTPSFNAEPNKIVNPNLSGVSGIPLKYWKEDSGSIVEMTSEEKSAVDDDSQSGIVLDKKYKVKPI